MKYEYWEYDNALIEMLFDTDLTVREIAKDLGVPETQVCQRIKLLGLDWIPQKHRKFSRGQTALTEVMKRLIPNEQIINEHHIGERLKLDVYCPRFKLAAEYHGRQHYQFVAQFHPTYEDFVRGQQRDERKLELCKEQGITVVSFKYCDDLTEDAVFDRLLNAVREADLEHATPKRKSRLSAKGSPHYEQAKMKRKAFERDLRRKIKQEHKDREQKRASQLEEADDLD
jgi:hypothetical protein